MFIHWTLFKEIKNEFNPLIAKNERAQKTFFKYKVANAFLPTFAIGMAKI